MTLFKHIFFRLLLVAIPLLMALAPAMAQNTVYKGNTTVLSVVPVSGDSYAWELYKDVSAINFATDGGNCPLTEAYFIGSSSEPSVTVMWTTPGTYFFKVTAIGGTCSNNLKVGKMIVLDSLPTAVILPHDPICAGTPTNLTVKLTGTAPWSITYTTNGVLPGTTISGIMTNTYSIPVNPLVNTTYQVISVTDANGTNSVPSAAVELIVNPTPVTTPILHN